MTVSVDSSPQYWSNVKRTRGNHDFYIFLGAVIISPSGAAAQKEGGKKYGVEGRQEGLKEEKEESKEGRKEGKEYVCMQLCVLL